MPLFAKIKVSQPLLLKEKDTRPIVCISMNRGDDFIPRVEAMVRLSATIPHVEIGEVVDYMELKREVNGNFIWFVRFLLPERDWAYLLCEKPLHRVNGKEPPMFNPISWSSFGAPLRISPDNRPGQITPDFNDYTAINALVSPKDIERALEEGMVPRPHRRRDWVPIEYHLLEEPTRIQVLAPDAGKFVRELEAYLQGEEGETGAGEKRSSVSVEYKAVKDRRGKATTPASSAASGLVEIEFASATEALIMYDVLHRKALRPRIKVFHSAREVEQVIQQEHKRIAARYEEEKWAKEHVRPSLASRLDVSLDGKQELKELDQLIDELKQTLSHETEEEEWANLPLEEVYGRFVVESQIEMNKQQMLAGGNGGGGGGEEEDVVDVISRIEVSSLQIASMTCMFDMKDRDLYLQNRRYGGSLNELLTPVPAPKLPEISPGPDFYKVEA